MEHHLQSKSFFLYASKQDREYLIKKLWRQIVQYRFGHEQTLWLADFKSIQAKFLQLMKESGRLEFYEVLMLLLHSEAVMVAKIRASSLSE